MAYSEAAAHLVLEVRLQAYSVAGKACSEACWGLFKVSYKISAQAVTALTASTPHKWRRRQSGHPWHRRHTAWHTCLILAPSRHKSFVESTWWRKPVWGEPKSSRWTKATHRVLAHWVCLPLRVVRIRDTVDNKLGLLAGNLCSPSSACYSWYATEGIRTLVVCLHVSQVVSASIMRLAHAHRVVGEVDIAVVAYRCQLVQRNRSSSEEPTEE